MAAKVVDVGNGKVELHTDRLRLRAAVESDSQYLHEVFTDSEVMRYWQVTCRSR